MAALVLALGVPAEGTAAVTYTVDRAVAPGRITGTIVTNGKIGPLTVADILDWNLAIDADGNGAATAKLLGPGSGGSASLAFFPQAAITATATGLFFDFSAYGPPPGPPLPPPGPPGPPAIVQFSSPATGGVWQLQDGFFSDELIQESVAPLIQARALRPPTVDQIAAAGPPPPLLVTTDTTLTEDRRGSIVIDADDVTLDCAEHAVQGEGSDIGMGNAGNRKTKERSDNRRSTHTLLLADRRGRLAGIRKQGKDSPFPGLVAPTGKNSGPAGPTRNA